MDMKRNSDRQLVFSILSIVIPIFAFLSNLLLIHVFNEAILAPIIVILFLGLSFIFGVKGLQSKKKAPQIISIIGMLLTLFESCIVGFYVLRYFLYR